MKRVEGEREFFGEWYKLLQKYGFPPPKINKSPQAEEFWRCFVDDVNTLDRKYEKYEYLKPFAHKECLGLINEIKRRAELVK